MRRTYVVVVVVDCSSASGLQFPLQSQMIVQRRPSYPLPVFRGRKLGFPPPEACPFPDCPAGCWVFGERTPPYHPCGAEFSIGGRTSSIIHHSRSRISSRPSKKWVLDGGPGSNWNWLGLVGLAPLTRAPSRFIIANLWSRTSTTCGF